MTTPEQHLAEVEEFLDVWDAAPAHRARYRDVISSQKSGEDGRKLRATTLRGLLAEVRRLRAENEQLSDLDDAATRRSELQGERDRAVTRWHEEHKRAEALNAERQPLARAGADRADERDAVEAERVRLATELGALDAQRAEDRVAYEDLQAAHGRLGEQAQRIVEAASQFRAERDGLYDAMEHVLLGSWESNGAGDVRSPWIPAGEVEGWRRLVADTPRSERDGETALAAPVAPVGSPEPSVDALGLRSAQRGAVGQDGPPEAERPAEPWAWAESLSWTAPGTFTIPISRPTPGGDIDADLVLDATAAGVLHAMLGDLLDDDAAGAL